MLKVMAARLIAAFVVIAPVVLLVGGGSGALPPGVSWT